MTTETIARTTIPDRLDPRVLARLLEEGYGPGAWHGADLRAALADVSPASAFQRPAPGRHNIAEIALHHGWFVRSVTAQLSGREADPFPIEGSDWFELSERGPLSWQDVLRTVEEHQRGLEAVVHEMASGARESALPMSERFDLVLGITCHAIYHAGQVQLIKVLTSRPDEAAVP